jgi:hypothetical protein
VVVCIVAPGSARSPKESKGDSKDSKDAKVADAPKGALKSTVGRAIILNRLGGKSAGSIPGLGKLSTSHIHWSSDSQSVLFVVDGKQDSKLGETRLSVGDRKDSSSRSGHADSARSGSLGAINENSPGGPLGKSMSPAAITSTSPPSEAETTFSPLSPVNRLNDDGTPAGAAIRRDSSKLKGRDTQTPGNGPRKYLSNSSSDEKESPQQTSDRGGSSGNLINNTSNGNNTGAMNGNPNNNSSTNLIANGGSSARRTSVALDVPISGGKRRASIGATTTIPSSLSTSSSSSPVPTSILSPAGSRKPGALPRHQSSLAAPDSNRPAAGRYDGPFSDRLIPGRNSNNNSDIPTGIQSDRVFSKKSSIVPTTGGGATSSLATSSSVGGTGNSNGTNGPTVTWAPGGRITPPLEGAIQPPGPSVSAWASRGTPPSAPGASSPPPPIGGNRLTEAQRMALERGEDIVFGSSSITINRTASISRTGELSQTSMAEAALSHRIADLEHDSPGLRSGTINGGLPGEMPASGSGSGSGSNNSGGLMSDRRVTTNNNNDGPGSDRAGARSSRAVGPSSRAESPANNNNGGDRGGGAMSERDRHGSVAAVEESYRGRQSSRERKSVIPDSAVVKPKDLYRPKSIDITNGRSPTSALSRLGPNSLASPTPTSTTAADVTRHLTDRANGNSQRSYRDRQRSDRSGANNNNNNNNNTGAGPVTDDHRDRRDRDDRDRDDDRRRRDRADRDRDNRDRDRDRRDDDRGSRDHDRDRDRDRRDDSRDRGGDRDRDRERSSSSKPRRDDDGKDRRKKERRSSYNRYLSLVSIFLVFLLP